MSECDVSSAESEVLSPEVAVRAGPGATLRTIREAQGLHIAMLAVSLKVPVAKLEALEADRYDLLPDTVFMRALASSVCRALKIDSVPILAALPLSQMRKIKTSESGLNATFNDSARNSGRALLPHLRKPLGITILVLLMGILAIVFLPAKSRDLNRQTLLIEEKSQMPPTAPIVAEANLPHEVSSSSHASAVPLTLSNSLSVDAQAAASSQALSPALNSSAPIVAPAINSGEILTLQARGASWVEVMDAKGTPQLRKTLMKDEVLSVSGALPLVVVLGRADLVSVKVRGQPFDVASMAENNVARFEVK